MEHPSLELLSGRAYPELARALRGGIESIVARWQEVVRRALPSADELTFAQLRDDMPNVLEHAVAALESDEPLATRKLNDLAPEHGATRFHQQFRFEELLVEHSIMRPIMLDEVTAQLGRPMTVGESAALMVALDVMTRQAALTFVDHQTRQLKAANEAQSKYLSFLSHDLRGGLNGVCLMIEVLRRELSREERFQESVDDLDMMRRSIFETIGTMDRFLHAERFRKGKVQVRPMRVNLKHLLAEVSAHFAYTAKDKSVELKFDAPPDSDVVSDKDLLTMILQNVTSNAIKYGARGRVDIAARRADGGAWQLSVTDRGPGIPADKLKDLFGPFTRGDTQGQPGVGLGLSIARQAADLLGAKLWAESPSASGEGTGTTFHLQLAPVKAQG
jgi:signal transduction histidine kinase